MHLRRRQKGRRVLLHAGAFCGLWSHPACLMSTATSALAGPAYGILIVTSSQADAYGEALEGLKARLASLAQQVDLIDVSAKDGPHRLAEVRHRTPRLLIVIGTAACEALSSMPAETPVLVTMVLRPDAVAAWAGEQRRSLVSTLSLDLPLEAILPSLKEVFPEETRLGVLHNPARNYVSVGALQASARQHGYSLRLAEVAGPADLLKAFVSLEGHGRPGVVPSGQFPVQQHHTQAVDCTIAAPPAPDRGILLRVRARGGGCRSLSGFSRCWGTDCRAGRPVPFRPADTCQRAAPETAHRH